ncbi:MAG: class I SAM-dependent methyltransferase [Candidatus Niyogibacteria bacterium]|nr:class I SAM-dependent methyltransferase [Candidatus Niyogibacteria bacterium]
MKNNFVKKFVRKVLDAIPTLLNAEEIRILDAAIHGSRFEQSNIYPEHQHYAYWERQSYFWDKVACPVRPSKGDIEIYSNFLKRKSQKNSILILGSTPEVRDLVSKETNAKIYIADFSYNMPSAMLRFTQEVDVLKETWIKSNWLELPFPAKFFDVILGDVVLHQVTPNLEPTLLEKIKYLLKDDGLFITRLFFLDEKFIQRNFDDITTQVLTGPFSNMEKITLLKLQTVWLFADLKERRFNRHLSEKKFSELMHKKNEIDPLLKKVHDVLVIDKDSYRDWSPPEEKELIRILTRFFKIVKRKSANDYLYSEYFPIVLLSQK